MKECCVVVVVVGGGEKMSLGQYTMYAMLTGHASLAVCLSVCLSVGKGTHVRTCITYLDALVILHPNVGYNGIYKFQDSLGEYYCCCIRKTGDCIATIVRHLLCNYLDTKLSLVRHYRL